MIPASRRSALSRYKGVGPQSAIIGVNDGQVHGSVVAAKMIASGITSCRCNVTRAGPSEITNAVAYGYTNLIYIVGNWDDEEELSTVIISEWLHSTFETLDQIKWVKENAPVGSSLLLEVGNEMYFKGPRTGAYQQKEPKKYAEMFMALHNALIEKGERSQVKLLFNAWGDYRISEKGEFSKVEAKRGWIGDSLTAQPGLKTAIDGFTHHPYGKPGENSENCNGPRATIALHKEIQELGFPSTDFYLTEYGIEAPGSTFGQERNKSSTEAEENANVKLVYEELLGQSYVKGIWWYTTYDNNSGSEKWGLYKGITGVEGETLRPIAAIIGSF